ncbi:MAG TPA: DUF58 domain-containing protein [Gemmatimonadaceae bacterium]|nr:DUF58 domain-containing protein [Gemmatimonadaceae bacterium]
MPVGPYGALLDAVRGVRWPARRPVAQGAPGVHHARSRGVAPEFAEYRPYRQGDDPKRLDWKLLARSDKAFIRLAPDHAVLGTTLLVDASASMAFPEREPNKWTQAKRLAVGLAAVAHASGDPVVVSGDGLRRLEPRTRAGVIADIARTLDAVRPSAAPGLADAVTNAAPRLAVLTDCLGDFDALRRALARHIARGGEAWLVHIVARAELEPGDAAMLATDPEDPARQRPLFAATREGYLENFAAFRAEVARALRADGVQYVEVRDDEASDAAVRRIARPAEVTR